MDNDWFAKAVSETKALPVKGSSKPVPVKPAPRTVEAAAALKDFAKVATGAASVLGTGPSAPGYSAGGHLTASGPTWRDPVKTTGLWSVEDVAKGIQKRISQSSDPRREASQWLTLLTNVITETVKELDLDS